MKRGIGHKRSEGLSFKIKVSGNLLLSIQRFCNLKMGTSIEDKTAVNVVAGEPSLEVRGSEPRTKATFGKRILAVIWDSLDKSPKERALIAKLDWFILSYVCVAYFVKYLDQTNVRTF